MAWKELPVPRHNAAVNYNASTSAAGRPMALTQQLPDYIQEVFITFFHLTLSDDSASIVGT